jgi:hypothetical protein
LIIAKNLGYAIDEKIFQKNERIKRMLIGLIKKKRTAL